jgi:nucleotide-binding universal stress UspA family protein
MFGTILAAIDGSEPGRDALATALKLGRICGAQVHAVHIIQMVLPSMSLGTLEPIDTTQELLFETLNQEADELLADAVRQASEQGVEFTTHKQWGSPGAEIVNLAGELGAGLVVLGSRGHSRLERIFLGSVSSFVVEHSPCATLVVR